MWEGLLSRVDTFWYLFGIQDKVYVFSEGVIERLYYDLWGMDELIISGWIYLWDNEVIQDVCVCFAIQWDWRLSKTSWINFICLLFTIYFSKQNPRVKCEIVSKYVQSNDG